MSYLIGKKEFAEAMLGHIDRMQSPPACFESMSVDDDGVRASISAVRELRDPKRSCKSRRMAFTMGMADGLALGIRAALIALGNQETLPDDKARCRVCNSIMDKPEVSEEEHAAAQARAEEGVREQLRNLGMDEEAMDGIEVMIAPAFICADCQRRLVAPLN